MSADNARGWLIVSNFALATVAVLFFLIAPELHYPLKPEEARDMLEIVAPVFVGNLAAGAAYAFRAKQVDASVLNSLTSYFIKGTPVVVAILSIALTVAFGLAAIPGFPPMELTLFKFYLVTILSIMTATTGAAITALFPKSEA